MILLELEQNTPAWHTWRRGGIGASHAATIMGADPPWGRKSLDAALAPPHRPAGVGRLNSSPMRARGLRARATGAPLARGPGRLPNAAYLRGPRGRFSWLRASLDGFDLFEGLILEIKCPNLEACRKRSRRSGAGLLLAASCNTS